MPLPDRGVNNHLAPQRNFASACYLFATVSQGLVYGQYRGNHEIPRRRDIIMRITLPRLAIMISSMVFLAVSPLSAKEAKSEKAARPELFQKLVNCRSIADNVARLACFDAQVARLEEAETRNELVVVDKAQVKKARKGLFGLSLPDLGLFGGNEADEKDPDQEGISKIESTIRSASQNTSGKWTIILEDGARWIQIDTGSIRTAKPGQAIKIRKASLGSYFANINGQAAIRMIRQN
jgi:hypothetical protein